nr:MAG: capsid protein [Cressdnaviricota sp.]
MDYSMAYRRRTYRKKRYNRRRGGGRSAASYVGGATKAVQGLGGLWTAVKALQALVNVEQKYVDVTAVSTSITTTPVTVLLNGIVQGVTENTRTGNSIKAHSLHVKGIIGLTAPATSERVRLMIVKFKEPQNGAIVPSQILETLTPISSIHSPYNIDSITPYNVMYDHVHIVNSNMVEKEFNITIPLRCHCTFNNNLGTSADFTKNSFWLMAIGENGSAQPTISYYSRFKFVDN